MVTADADLNLAAQRAGVNLTSDPVMAYLKAIKVQTSSTIAVYFKDVPAVQTTIQKLAAGINVRGTEYKLGSEDPDAVHCPLRDRQDEVPGQHFGSHTKPHTNIYTNGDRVLHRRQGHHPQDAASRSLQPAGQGIQRCHPQCLDIRIEQIAR